MKIYFPETKHVNNLAFVTLPQPWSLWVFLSLDLFPLFFFPLLFHFSENQQKLIQRVRTSAALASSIFFIYPQWVQFNSHGKGSFCVSQSLNL